MQSSWEGGGRGSPGNSRNLANGAARNRSAEGEEVSMYNKAHRVSSLREGRVWQKERAGFLTSHGERGGMTLIQEEKEERKEKPEETTIKKG